MSVQVQLSNTREDYSMTKTALTADERQCLQMWFRQALAQVEAEEAAHRLLREHAEDSQLSTGHRPAVARRRSYRAQKGSHLKQLAY